MIASTNQSTDFVEGHVLGEQMSLALDGLLAAPEQVHFDQHLLACDACRVAMGKWQRISDTLQAEPLVGPSPGFVLRADQLIRREQQRRERLLGGLVVGGGTLAIWTLVALGSVLAVMLWVGSSPMTALPAIDYLGFSSQLVALIIHNLGDVRDTLLAVLPSPQVTLGLASAVLFCTIAWVWLISRVGGRAGSAANNLE